jgi:FAD/FMN-containing dehydrogenase
VINSQNLITRTSPLYEKFSGGYMATIKTTPLAIFRATEISQVAEIVKCCNDNKLLPVPRSGGHSFEAFSSVTGSVVIDLSQLENVEIFQFQGEWFAKVESGIRLGNLYKKLYELGNFAMNAGSCLGYFNV